MHGANLHKLQMETKGCYFSWVMHGVSGSSLRYKRTDHSSTRKAKGCYLVDEASHIGTSLHWKTHLSLPPVVISRECFPSMYLTLVTCDAWPTPSTHLALLEMQG